MTETPAGSRSPMPDNGPVCRTTTERATLRTPLTSLLLILTTALALSSCSGETPAAEQTSTSPSASASAGPESTEPSEPAEPEPTGTVIDVTVKGDSVHPNGDTVKVGVGEPVTLNITADRAGALHVHSSPAEQELEFDKGIHEFVVTIDRPGVVEIEEHEAGKVVVQLQVS